MCVLPGALFLPILSHAECKRAAVDLPATISGTRALVDATHPYASVISQQLIGLSRELQIPYLRYERPSTIGVAAAAPELPWRQALQKNDLRDWVPAAPVFLCGGDVDPLVFFFITQLMQIYWAAQSPPNTRVYWCGCDSESNNGNLSRK